MEVECHGLGPNVAPHLAHIILLLKKLTPLYLCIFSLFLFLKFSCTKSKSHGSTIGSWLLET